MLPGSLTDADVREWTTTVLVNGVPRPVSEVTLSRDMSSDMPEQVVAGGKLARTTGDVQWAADVEASDNPANPWNDTGLWLPSDGERVQVYVSDGTLSWPRGTFLIDDAAGDIGRSPRSSLVDLVDRLAASVNLPALLARMPPLDSTGPWRRIGLTPRFVIDTAYRRSGFFATPGRQSGAVLDVPLQGSAWPLLGVVTACERTSVGGQSPLRYENAGGFASMGDFNSTFTPSQSNSASTPVQITMITGSTSSGTARVRLNYGATQLDLQHSGTAVALRLNGTTVVSVPAAGGVLVQGLVKGGTATLRTDTGQTATAAISFTGTTTLATINITAAATAHLAGVQVSHPSAGQEFQGMLFSRTCIIEPGSMHGLLAATPAMRYTSASEIIGQICESLLWASWIDETGVARCVASDVLRNRASVATLTTLDHITALSWRRRYLDVRSTVQVSYKAPTTTLRRDYSVPVWEATDSVSLGNEDIHEQVISPGSDEFWIMPDTYLQVLGQTGEMTKLNQGIWTVAGGVVTDGVNESWAADPANNNLTVSMTQKAESEWTFKAEAKNLVGIERVELRTFSEQFVGTTGMWPMWWGKSLPIVRAKAKITFTERERPEITAAGRGPALHHSTSTWATGNTDEVEFAVVDQVATYLADSVKNPAPLIERLSIVYDPRLQVGDVVTISSEDFMGATLKVLITSISESLSQTATMDLSVRVISAQKSYTTYREFEKAWGDSASYTDLVAAWGELSNYTDFNNNPLGGTA